MKKAHVGSYRNNSIAYIEIKRATCTKLRIVIYIEKKNKEYAVVAVELLKDQRYFLSASFFYIRATDNEKKAKNYKRIS